MEQSDDKNFTLEDHVEKCRCCFRVLKEQEFSDITKAIEKKFFALTQIQVSFEKNLIFFEYFCLHQFIDLKS